MWHTLALVVALTQLVACAKFAVNMLKGKAAAEWNSESAFDAEKDKNGFRQYEEACERVKNFYREQHGEWSSRSPLSIRAYHSQ